MDRPLMTLTRILLVLWALVTVPGGLLLVFYPPFATAVVWPPPLEAIPPFHAQLNGALGIGTGIASFVALRMNRWSAARPMIALYVAYAIPAEYVTLSRVAAGPVPWQSWFYILLGAVYLIASVVIWRQQGSAS